MYTDILTRIQNASMRHHDRVKAPYSAMDLAVLEVLASRGYVESVSRKGRGVRRIIDIQLKYQGEEPGIHGFRFIGKPSRRIYCGYRDIKASKQGHGDYILSTPKGILTGHQARNQKVGGEVLFELW